MRVTGCALQLPVHCVLRAHFATVARECARLFVTALPGCAGQQHPNGGSTRMAPMQHQTLTSMQAADRQTTLSRSWPPSLWASSSREFIQHAIARMHAITRVMPTPSFALQEPACAHDSQADAPLVETVSLTALLYTRQRRVVVHPRRRPYCTELPPHQPGIQKSISLTGRLSADDATPCQGTNTHGLRPRW